MKNSGAAATIRVKNIMVPVDFSQAAVFAVRCAAALAQDQQARLYMLHVKAPFPVHGRIAGGAMEHVQRQRNHMEHNALCGLIPDSVKNSIAVEDIQVTGLPMARVIVEKARELSIDVIVIPAQKSKGWLRFFKENVVQRVIQNAPCSVLVVRDPQNKDTPAFI